MEKYYTDIGYVEASTYRQKVIQALDDKILTPTGISQSSGIRTNHISKTLSELKKRDIIVCLNEEARKGRLYKLTDKGSKILKNMRC